ncbi:MAG: preprotein translocase subunit SecG [Pontiella sp.]
MIFLQSLALVVLVLCALLLIGLVLLQKSKSEGLGMAFGAGAGESLFGARAGNVLSKATVTCGVVFMSCALLLGVIFSQKDTTLMDGVSSDPVSASAIQTQPVPVLDIPTEPVAE